MTPSRQRHVPYLLVALVAAAVHLQTIVFPFVFDDWALVVYNEFLREGWSVVTAFARHFWHGTPAEPGYYRPVVVASLAINGRALGWGPVGFHLVNVLLHAANAALMLGLLRRLGIGAPAAILAALFFAVHPVAAWPVGSIAARVDLLPVFFLLPAAIALAGGRAIAMGACFLMALLCKESALAFLGVPFLAMRGPRRDDSTAESGGTTARETAAACAVAALAALVAYLAMRFAAGVPFRPDPSNINPLVNPLAHMAQPGRLLAALALAGRYMLYLLMPIRFSDPAGYGEAAVPPAWDSPAVLLAGAVLILWALAALVLWLRRDRAGIPLAFALAAFLPASNLVVPHWSLYAQNFAYLPLAGLTVAAGDLLDRTLRGASVTGRRVTVGAAALLLVALAAGAAREARLWRSEEALFTAWTERFPRYGLGWSWLGIALLAQGNTIGAEDVLRTALEIEERSGDAHDSLGVALLATAAPGDRDRLEESLAHSRRASALLPDRIETHVNAASALMHLGRPAEAEAEARAALAINAGAIPARVSLAEALIRQERYRDALDVLRGLAKELPQDPNVRSPLVVSLINAGDLEEARVEAEAARRDFPDLAWFDFCLARVAARSGRRDEAIDLLRRAREREPQTTEWFRKVADFAGYPEP
jgi:tetratricopeptide (TPR) repeat protein